MEDEKAEYILLQISIPFLELLFKTLHKIGFIQSIFEQRLWYEKNLFIIIFVDAEFVLSMLNSLISLLKS